MVVKGIIIQHPPASLNRRWGFIPWTNMQREKNLWNKARMKMRLNICKGGGILEYIEFFKYLMFLVPREIFREIFRDAKSAPLTQFYASRMGICLGNRKKKLKPRMKMGWRWDEYESRWVRWLIIISIQFHFHLRYFNFSRVTRIFEKPIQTKTTLRMIESVDRQHPFDCRWSY